jgi:hypothetical protein
MYIPVGEGGRLEGDEEAPRVEWASEDAVPLVASPFWYARRSHWWCCSRPLRRAARGQAHGLGSVMEQGPLVDGEGSDGGASSTSVHWRSVILDHRRNGSHGGDGILQDAGHGWRRNGLLCYRSENDDDQCRQRVEELGNHPPVSDNIL